MTSSSSSSTLRFLNYQRINCGAPAGNAPFNCHRKFICAYLIKMRAACISSHVAPLLCVSSIFVVCIILFAFVCQILFTCGSNGCPIPCHCVKIFGHEEPIPSTTYSGTSFADVCKTISNWGLKMSFHPRGETPALVVIKRFLDTTLLYLCRHCTHLFYLKDFMGIAVISEPYSGGHLCLFQNRGEKYSDL